MTNDNCLQCDMTLVINTCDAYQDVLGVFFQAFKDLWPDCPYSVVINTELANLDYQARVHNYFGVKGEDNWGERLRLTLSSIDSEFVLMLYDDFILDGPVENSRIEHALQLLREQVNAAVVYLVNTSLPLVSSNKDRIFVPVKDKADYRLNSSPAIWRRQALMGYTAPDDTPWAWEVFGTYRSWGDGHIFYSLNPKEADIYPYNYSKGGAIYRGKWVREVVDKLSPKYKLDINWSQRGYASDAHFEKRSLMWKIRFMKTGFNMVGFKALYFVVGYIKAKSHAR